MTSTLETEKKGNTVYRILNSFLSPTHTEITEICLEAIKVHSFEMIAANILILYIREGQ